MSVMQKLRAIRERIATQAEESEAATEAEAGANHNVHALHGNAGAGTASGTEKPTTASMWDLVHDPDGPDEDDSLPALEEVLPSLNNRPAAAEPEPAPAAAPEAAPVPEPVKEIAPRFEAVKPVEVRPLEQSDETSQRRPGRVKTRLLGFEHSNGKCEDLVEKIGPAATTQSVRFPVGWLVVVEGPGLGASIPLLSGVSQIGRDEDQAVQLDFGDTSISRTNHASVAFDEEERAFYVGHGGKSNLVRLNGKPLLSTERLNHGNTIRVGETTLRLVALCGENFSWAELSNSQATANL